MQLDVVMKNTFKTFLIIVLLTGHACSKENVNESTDDQIPVSGSSHFNFVLYDGLTTDITPTIIQKLEENYSRILNDLKVEKMDPVKIQVWNNETEFQNVIKRDLGTTFPGATGYVYGRNDVRVLNRGNAGNTAQTALHEFCHTVSMYVNSSIPNNPRWLWEAAAVYESGEFINPKSIAYMAAGNFPTINELNTDYNSGNQKIYSVGYVLAEYIIQTWGKDKFIDLLRTNGNIQSSLGISGQSFEAGWKDFVTKKYLA